MVKLIALEGIDGSGKTIQGIKLYDYFLSCNKNVWYMDFPMYDVNYAGNRLHYYLNGTFPKPDAMSMALWYAIDRVEAIHQMANGLDSYDYVIFNRWTLSSMVYQENPQWVYYLEKDLLKLPTPDLYLIFDIEPKIAMQRKFKQKGNLDVYESQLAKQNEARNKYITFFSTYAHFNQNYSIINTMDGEIEYDVNQIFEQVIKSLHSYSII